MRVVHRVITASDWQLAQSKQQIAPNALDSQSGFVHLSTSSQTTETLRRYFSPEQQPIVLEICVNKLGDDLKWERVLSRREDMPHLYRELRFDDLLGTRLVTYQSDGVHIGSLRPIESD